MMIFLQVLLYMWILYSNPNPKCTLTYTVDHRLDMYVSIVLEFTTMQHFKFSSFSLKFDNTCKTRTCDLSLCIIL